MTDPPTVLVVEDEPDLRSLFDAFLSDTYHVVTASTAEAALEKLESHIDVVLLDRLLPGKRGEEIADEIKDRGEFMVAMVTAVEPDVEVIDMGFDDYVAKPVSRQELNEVVEQLLRVQTYDEQVSELFQLSKKRAILLEDVGEEALTDSEEFAALEERIRAVLTTLDDINYGFPDDDDHDAVRFEEVF